MNTLFIRYFSICEHSLYQIFLYLWRPPLSDISLSVKTPFIRFIPICEHSLYQIFPYLWTLPLSDISLSVNTPLIRYWIFRNRLNWLFLLSKTWQPVGFMSKCIIAELRRIKYRSKIFYSTGFPVSCIPYWLRDSYLRW